MSDRWVVTAWEDDRLQGCSAECQVLYLRGFRRYADFDTGAVRVTLGLLRRLLEFLPDKGSREAARRKEDVSHHFIRARIAELERAQLIKKEEKKPGGRFEEPVYTCVVWSQGQVRPELGPQMNRKEGTASRRRAKNIEATRVYEDAAVQGGVNEPQGGNRNISGNTNSDAKASAADDVSPEQLVWRSGLAYLKQYGGSEATIRSFLGRLVKKWGKARVASTITSAILESPVEPRAWILASLERGGGNEKNRGAGNNQDRRAAVADKMDQDAAAAIAAIAAGMDSSSFSQTEGDFFEPVDDTVSLADRCGSSEAGMGQGPKWLFSR